MKERTKNVLGYGALLSGALVLGSAMMAGSYSLYEKSVASSMSDAKNKKFNESLIRYAEQLQISNNPRDLAVATLFLDFHEMLETPEQAAKPMHVEQLRRAIALSPQDPDIAWLEAMGCGRLDAACDVENALARLRTIEPDNLAVHMLTFNLADKAGNAGLRQSALQAMASSRYSDIHYSSIGKMHLDALRGWHAPMELSVNDIFGDDIDQSPVTVKESRKIAAIGFTMAMGLPALQPLLTQCKRENLSTDEIQVCQKIATLMVKDKTMIMHRVGLRIGLAVFKQEPLASQWREANRVSYWQLNGYDPRRKAKFSERKHFNAWPNVDEIAQQRQRLIDKAIPLTPPDGWMPESEEIQKLLKTPTANNP